MVTTSYSSESLLACTVSSNEESLSLTPVAEVAVVLLVIAAAVALLSADNVSTAEAAAQQQL